MTDPNDFTASLADVVAALEARVREGVEQPDSYVAIFKSSVTSYELPRPAFAITRVSGMRKGVFTVFRDGEHYSFLANRLIWNTAAEMPDEASRLDIEFTYREPRSGLTDFNPGSVVGTLVRAVAREVTLLYDQMDQAYRRAFIDGASGVALDNVVALLGSYAQRNPALKAKGAATFLLKKAATQTIAVPAGARISDPGGRLFVTTAEGRIPTETDEIAAAGATVKTINKMAALTGVWRKGDPTDDGHRIATGSGFGPDERTVTLTAPLPTGDLLVRYQPKSVTVPIEAVEAGPEGNVNAGTLTVMPTPPPGIDNVTNETPTDGGQNAEPDDRLKERAKHALERAGNATLNAIRFAVLEVDGVEGCEVLDHQRDEAIPLGEVRVRYSGGDPDKVRQAIEQTRAAGVMVRADFVAKVLVSGTFYALAAERPPASAGDPFLKAAVKAIGELSIGAPLSVGRLSALAFQFPGLAAVAEAQLCFSKPDPSHPRVPLTGDVSDPFLAAASELVRPDAANLKVVLLVALKATANRKGPAGTPVIIDLQIADPSGAAAPFRNFSLDCAVTLRATLKATPDLAPERLGTFTHTVRFTAATGSLNIPQADVANFDPAKHKAEVEFSISAAAYPGLAPATRIINVVA
jgi:uncharacterized phage protein gp47/JayE